jgi:2,3-bisphosphoglycerate-independent phosphoglycerate mutase
MSAEIDVIRRLRKSADSKIVMLVLDGLGGLPRRRGGGTELEEARTPNLDALASDGICGLHEPSVAGITAGSGPGHLALFGYDPFEHQVGRGVLGALGINFELTPRDVAARGNFCTVDDQGHVTDRRAGRIATDRCRGLCEKLRRIDVPDAELHVEPIKDHRFLFVLRADDLGSRVSDTDPQETGRPPLPVRSLESDAQRTASLVKHFLDQAKQRLADEHPANMVILRGFSKLPQWALFEERYGLRGAALADYPMYRGVSKLLGMKVVDSQETLSQKVARTREIWADFDFFFLHHKQTDSAGEDGDFDRKVREIEKVDAVVPALREIGADVLLITGDHSTPATLKEHSWHPVPIVLCSDTCRPDGVTEFGERPCIAGGLGPRIPTTDLIPLALAHASRLTKFDGELDGVV